MHFELLVSGIVSTYNANETNFGCECNKLLPINIFVVIRNIRAIIRSIRIILCCAKELLLI